MGRSSPTFRSYMTLHVSVHAGAEMREDVIREEVTEFISSRQVVEILPSTSVEENSSKSSSSLKSPSQREDLLDTLVPTVTRGVSAVAEFWAAYKYKPEEERVYNSYWSQEFPHCSLCVAVIKPRVINNQWKQSKPVNKPTVSPVWFPFHSIMKDCKRFPGAHSDVKVLLTCKDCLLCVHSSCYGVEGIPSLPDRWQCDKCFTGQPDQVFCCLCYVRCGALKATTDGRWVHLLCALSVPGVTFEFSSHSTGVNITHIKNPKNMICGYCGLQDGATVPCCQPKCRNSFHSTCGLVSGARFEISKSTASIPLKARCCKHVPISDQEVVDWMPLYL